MGRIEDLRQNLLSMTHEEKLAKIRQIRVERKITRNPVKEKAARSASKKTVTTLANKLKGFTEAQLRELGLVP